MPILRKLTTVGDSRGLTLPKSWIDYLERKNQCRITEVELEVNGAIIVRAVLPKKVT
jgi:antitoxin component of MazEF toxin-antitoxin module